MPATTSRIKDSNGFITIPDNPISRVGVFPYSGKMLGKKDDPNGIYYVLRPEEELSSPETIESFKLLPWVDEHTMLGERATPAEEKGVHGVIGEDVYYKDGVLYGNLKVFSDYLAHLIESGKTELSCGYRARFEFTPGVYQGKEYHAIQRFIRGNHMATVDDGRVDVAVLDHMKFVFDAKEIQIMEEGTIKKEPVADSPDISEVLGMVLAELKNVVTLLKELKPAAAVPAPTQDEDLPEGAADPVVAAAADLVEAIKEEVKTDDPEKPEGIGDGDGTGVSAAEDKPTMDHKDVKPGTQRVPTVKDLMREISLKNQMAETLSHHIGVFDHSEMDIKDVAKYGVKKLDIRCQPGSEIQTLSGYLQAKKPPRPASDVMDSKEKAGSKISQYIDGGE